MYCSIREFNEYDFSGDLTHIGEVSYRYDKTDTMEKLKMTKDSDRDFVFAYNGVPTEDDLTEMNMLLEARDNVKFLFFNIGSLLLPDDKKPSGRYFYSYENLKVDNFDMLRAALDTGVSDVYISGLLGFEMEKVRKMCGEAGVKIRVVPNIASRSGLIDQGSGDDTTSFWIRPEDLDMYETYIDIIEFSGENEKQNVYYDVYFQDKAWHGNLSELIAGRLDIKNKGLTNHFGECRANCGKKCLFNICHKCYKFVALAELVVDNDLKIEEESI